MLMFFIKNYRATLAISTVLIVPIILASWGFILETSKSNASVPVHEERIIKLEQLSYRIDERYKFIKEALEEIKANQERFAKKSE